MEYYLINVNTKNKYKILGTITQLNEKMHFIIKIDGMFEKISIDDVNYVMVGEKNENYN